MNQIFIKIIVLSCLLAVGSLQIVACSVDIPPFRKDFRWADRIFLGEVVDILDKPATVTNTESLPVFGVVKFQVEKSWKGSNGQEILLPSDVAGGICPGSFDSFKKGEKYLVFAKRNYAPFVMSTKLQIADDKMHRLDNFWFRTWARVYPF